MLWIIIPLIAFAFFAMYVRRAAERARAEMGEEVVRGRKWAVRDRPHVLVKIRLAGTGMATRQEVHARQELEDEIERRGIGSIADANSGKGFANLHVVVADADRASAQISDLLRDAGVLDRATIEAVTPG